VRVINVGDPFVKQIRVAETQKTVTRVVLDLEGPVEFTTSQLQNPDRLIIELHAPGHVPSATPGDSVTLAQRPRPAAPALEIAKPVERRTFQPPVIPAKTAAERTPADVALLDAPPKVDAAPSAPSAPRASFHRDSCESHPAILSGDRHGAKSGIRCARAGPPQ
jgi:hypothetical protein